MPSSNSRALIALVVASFTLFAIGLVAAKATLPEWEAGAFPARDVIEARFLRLLESLDIQPESAQPLAYLVSADDMGPGGGGGLEARVAQPAGWHGVTGGRIYTGFGSHGGLRSLEWMPRRFAAFYELSGKEPDAKARTEMLLPLFLAPGESAGARRQVSVGGFTFDLIPLRGTGAPEHFHSSVATNLVVTARRAAGTLEDAESALRHYNSGGLWLRFAIKSGLFVAVFLIFMVLLAKNRLDFKDGLVVATLSLVGSLGGTLSRAQEGLAWWQVGGGALLAALLLFLVWSAAESWLRTTQPDFTTSLDFLRAGRLGPRGGRALLAGWACGAALAGVWLLLHVAAVRVPGLIRAESSVNLPLFQDVSHPFYDGPLVAGLVLLGLTLGARLIPAPGKAVAGIVAGALLLAPKIHLRPLPFRLGACLAIAALLVFVFRRFGLVALLTAAITSFLLPAAVLAAQHLSWLPGTFIATTLPLLALPLLGLVGLRRPPETEGEAMLPAFVRRVEEERRLKYEMDLLARMQIDLLPGTPPQVPGYDLAATSMVATEAGGDFYDFFYDEAGRFWLAAGDVAGHGYACTIELAMIKSALHSLVAANQTPAAVLAKIDRVLRESRTVRSFSSLTLLVLEPATGRGLISNAAHPFPLLCAGVEVEEIDLPSLPLGQGPARHYEDRPLCLVPGAVLFFASDGLAESTNAAGTPYGFERAPMQLPALAAQSAEAILSAMVADWRRHRGAEPVADDTSLVVLRRLPEAAEAESDEGV